MYSEYTALFTHNTQRTCTVSYTLYNVHIGSQLYLGIILHYVQNVCKNKCAVCTLYSVYITYFRLGPRASFKRCPSHAP